MTSRGYGRSSRAYIIRVRNREQHEIAIHGGTKRGGGRRRVTRWSKWHSHRYADTPRDALDQFEAVRKLNPLSDVQVFLGAQRVTIEQLETRARNDAGRAMYGDDWCSTCDVRERSGLEGKCPACAHEQARAELERGRGGVG